MGFIQILGILFPKHLNLPTFLVDVGQEATFPIATSEIAAELPTTTATGEVSRDHVVRDVGVRDVDICEIGYSTA